jgi:nitrous oxidase accessory protein NosD
MKQAFPSTWVVLPLLALSSFAAQAQTALYVNDAATTGDVFTTAVGSDASGNGSAAAPFATVARALSQADAATQTIFIDAGTYTERVVLNKAVSLQGAGNATAQPSHATIFDGGLTPSATQTDESGLWISAGGGSVATPLTIADITFRAFDSGIQTDNIAPRANVLVEDVEVVDNRRNGILWNCQAGVQNLTFRRLRASRTAEGANTNANGAGRGLFLANGVKHHIVVEDGIFEGNRRSGIDVNDGSVSELIIRGNRFAQNLEPAVAVLGAGGQRDGSGNFISPAALIENNIIRESSSTGLEFKSCTGSGRGQGNGSFVVRYNTIARPSGAPSNLSLDKAGIVFIDRDRNVINPGGGINGDLVTGGAFIQGNTIRGYLADANAANVAGFGLVLEGSNNKAFGNVITQCQVAVQVQDRPTANAAGTTPFYDISRSNYLVSAGDSIRGNRLDSCATAIRAVNLTNPVDASLNWLGGRTADLVRGTTGIDGAIVTLGGPATSFAQVSALTPTGLVDYSPFLNSAADEQPAAGFQPGLSYLHVDSASPQAGPAAALAEGLALVSEGGTLNAVAGTYAESLTIDKNLTLTNTGATVLRDLILNGSGKVLSLGSPLTLTGALTLSNGLLQTSTATLLTLADQATATAGNASSYVNGPLRKQGQQAFVFPLGKGGHWARLGISAPATATSAFTAEYVDAAYADRTATAPLSEVSQFEHWTLTGSDAVSVALFWEDSFRSAIDDFSADLQVATYTGSSWQTAGNGGLSGSLSAGSVTSGQAVSGFTAFTFGSLSPSVNPLATQVSGITAAQTQPGSVAVQWTMAAENNTYGYAVERSADASSWQQIGFVASRGISSQPQVYTYQDQTVQGLSRAYYRLRQTSPSGSVRYSAVADAALSTVTAVKTSSAGQFSLYPNPATDRITLVFPKAITGAERVVLSDLSGRAVLSQTLATGKGTEVALLLPTLPAGIYLLQVQGPGLSGQPQRLVVK